MRTKSLRRFALAIALLAAAAPPARADFAAGAAAYDKGDYAAALAEWTAMADAGDPRSQLGLGTLYESGRGLPAPDLPQAVNWYRAAAAQGPCRRRRTTSPCSTPGAAACRSIR